MNFEHLMLAHKDALQRIDRLRILYRYQLQELYDERQVPNDEQDYEKQDIMLSYFNEVKNDLKVMELHYNFLCTQLEIHAND